MTIRHADSADWLARVILGACATPTTSPCRAGALSADVERASEGAQCDRSSRMPIDYADLRAEKPRPTLYKTCAERFIAEVGKLSIRVRELRAQLVAGQIAADDPCRADDRPVSRLYAREDRA